MPPKLSEDEIVTLQVLKEKRQSNCQIAQTLGVTAGTVRYHLRRAGQPDGRADKVGQAESWAAVQRVWGKFAVVQRCQAHKKRNVEAHLPDKHHDELRRQLNLATTPTIGRLSRH